MTAESIAALAELRRGDHFEWHVLGALSFVIYVYASAARRGEWDRVALGAGFWALELCWEMLNALVLHFTGHAALWTVAGHSSFLIYVGLNLEISLMFAVMPMILFQLLPPDPRHRSAGIPSRVLIPLALGLFCVAVECLLNRAGALVWAWPFWRWPHLELIVVAYCAPLLALTWVHHHVRSEAKVRGALVAFALAALGHYTLAHRLEWI